MQGAGHELSHLASFQSESLCTEIKTLCVLFFVNERTHGLGAGLRGILNLSRLEQFLANRETQSDRLHASSVPRITVDRRGFEPLRSQYVTTWVQSAEIGDGVKPLSFFLWLRPFGYLQDLGRENAHEDFFE